MDGSNLLFGVTREIVLYPRAITTDGLTKEWTMRKVMTKMQVNTLIAL